MSIFDKIKENIFVEDQPDTVEPVAPVPVIPLAPVHIERTAPPSSDDLAALRAKVHPKGGPLVAFAATLKSLSTYIPEESARYHAAQETLLAQGISVDDVLSGINLTVGLIDGEIHAFEQARDEKVAKEITGRESALADLATQLAGHEATIQSLIAQRDQVAAQLTTERAKIASRAEQFHGSADALKNEYGDAANKIRRYLVAGGSK